jgi:hypothetical protein
MNNRSVILRLGRFTTTFREPNGGLTFMRKQIFLAAAAAGAVLSATAALPASAASTPVLTVGKAGGAAVNVGDAAAASLAANTSATIFTTARNSTGVTCKTSAFDATIVTNPAAPGTATESLGTQTFSNCTSNIVGVSGVNSITVQNLPYNAAVSDANDTITLTAGSKGPIQVTANLQSVLGAVNCTYQANGGSLTGTVSNSTNSITFSKAQFNLTTGANVCPKNGFFSATYSPVTDTTQGGQKIFVN